MRSDQFKLLVGNEFPYPIALPFRRAQEDEESRESVCALLLATLEYVGLVLVCDYLAQEDRNPELDSELRRLLEKAPSEGTWQDWICRILTYFGDHSRSPILPEARALLDRSARQDLSKLIAWRNGWVHRGRSFDMGQFRRRIFGLLERLVLIHKHVLFCPHQATFRKPLHSMEAALLKGDNPIFGHITCRCDTALEADHMYLYARETRELLPLHPLFVCASCVECGEQHFFQYSQPGDHKLAYASIPGGHKMTDPEAYRQLEGLFRHPRARRLKPRHFSVPGAFAGLPRTLQPGDHVGPYQVDELIKIGGMAQIYRAMDTRTGKNYALKLLPVEMSRDPLLLVRFDEEAQNLKRLNHPNIVHLHDLGEDFGDRYLILDLAVGGVVGTQRCRDLSELKKPVAEEDIIAIGKQVCDGLDYMHRQGILHRDLKPGNLLLDGDRVLLTDFGVSRGRGAERITLTGMPVGTPEYMAPEQILGEEDDCRTDIYALGCVLYELATGRPPYRADTPLTITRYHLQARPPRIEELNPRISSGLANIIYKALHKRPESRHQSARKLHEDLSRAAGDPAGPQLIEGEQTPQDRREEDLAQEKRKYRRRLAVCIAAIAILSIGLATQAALKLSRSWKSDVLVGEAATAWAGGPSRWEACCEGMREAFTLAGETQRLEDLRSRVFSEGSLAIHAMPPSAELGLTPAGDIDELLGLDLEPRLLTDGGFRPGRAIPIAPGHYHIKVREGSRHLEFPVFVGRVLYRRHQGGGWRLEHLLPGEDRGPLDKGEQMILAEQVEIGPLDLYTDAPEGTCLIPPGPFWRSEDPDVIAAREVGPHVHALMSPGMVRDHLEAGIFMGKYEVTVGQFRRWFERPLADDPQCPVRSMGEAACYWLWEEEVRKRIPYVSDIPLPVLKELWADDLKKQGLDAAAFENRRALAEAAYGSFRKSWMGQVNTLESMLADASDDHLPATRVTRNVALSYCRTHAGIRAAEFQVWLEEKLRETEAVCRAMRDLMKTLGEASRETVAIGELPDTPKILHRGNCLTEFWRNTIADAYLHWLDYGYGRQWLFACQIPAERVVRLARGDGLTFGTDLEEIERTLLEDPYQRLDARGEYGQLFLHWFHAVKRGAEHLDKACLLRWLVIRLKDEEEREVMLRRLLAGAAERPPKAGVDDLDIPWDLRLEYGWQMGWDLPEIREWEKAFRGDDGRPHPWGRSPGSQRAWLGPGRGKPRSVMDLDGYGPDVSPYGVVGMAGNASEWVKDEPGGLHLLKGGNFEHDASFANGGHSTVVTPGVYAKWAGFRVVKRLSTR